MRKINIVTLAALVLPTDSIDMVVRKISNESKSVLCPGMAVILSPKNLVLGIVTDGDIRRAYTCGISFSKNISEIMISDPITVSEKISEDVIELEVVRKAQLNNRLHSNWVRYVLVVNGEGQLVNIIDYFKILQNQAGLLHEVVVFGMGYVGITLAVSLSNQGHQVLGIDKEIDIVSSLNKGTSHVVEPGLSHMLSDNLKRSGIKFSTTLEEGGYSFYIIAVGTPLNLDSKPDMSALISVLNDITRVLKQGDHVMLRSTVPVGVTRGFVVPYLESKTELKAGKDFYVSFVPERTIEGNAMYELKNLPQIVGGYSSQCSKNSLEFWSTLTHSVVLVDSLEAAELIKLANNTFRDLSFAFANELALLGDRYNVNAFELIKSANKGYPRNKIPNPSPGVGGYCLTKDPILFSCTSEGPRSDAVLGVSSRKINERAAVYPITLIKRFAKKHNIIEANLNVLIMGIAFKGVPETCDVRGSTAIDVFNELNSIVSSISGWDAVISQKEIIKMGINGLDNLKNAIYNADVVLIMNNHPGNTSLELFSHPKSKRLLFDGWNQIDRIGIEKVPGLEYSTMGYSTK
jgi:UDP-N-acetyl-D-mannosaminuronic acid dehydrogenase